MALPSSALTILSLTPPTASSRTITTTLLPSDASTLDPSTSLSFSFANGTNEVFVDRITHRELDVRDDGSVVATVLKVPGFRDPAVVTEVKMYVWKGERLLGEWNVGRY